MDYIRDHWQGRHALPRAFWINTLLPFVLLALIEPSLRPMPAGGSLTAAVFACLYVLVGHGLVLTWQMVGLWRSCRRYLESGGDLAVATFAQAAVLVLPIAAGGATLSTLEAVFGTGPLADEATAATRYSLRTSPDGRTLSIEGPFDVGLSRDLKALLVERPAIRRIVLNSDGGRIFEARGVARQILERRLDTTVLGACRSACTIAFAAGRHRTIGKAARLGFHSYRLDGFMAFVDPLAEQEKDEAFLVSRKIDPAFVARIFESPHDAMWHPEPAELLRAGVIHEIVEG